MVRKILSVVIPRFPDGTPYTDDDKKQIMVTVNFALTIKKIIDSKLIDEEGEITKQSLEALSKGEEYLGKINSMLK